MMFKKVTTYTEDVSDGTTFELEIYVDEGFEDLARQHVSGLELEEAAVNAAVNTLDGVSDRNPLAMVLSNRRPVVVVVPLVGVTLYVAYYLDPLKSSFVAGGGAKLHYVMALYVSDGKQDDAIAAIMQQEDEEQDE